MTEQDIVICMACRRQFPQTRAGAEQYVDHRRTCRNSTFENVIFTKHHPSGHDPKGAA